MQLQNNADGAIIMDELMRSLEGGRDGQAQAEEELPKEVVTIILFTEPFIEH